MRRLFETNYFLQGAAMASLLRRVVEDPEAAFGPVKTGAAKREVSPSSPSPRHVAKQQS